MLLKYFDILNLFSKDLNKPRYASELAKLLNANQKTISNSLNDLAKNNILTYDYQGKNKLFRFNKTNSAKEILLQINLEKKLILRKKLNLLLSSLEKEISLFLVFGSYANNTQTPSSDLDVLIIGDYNVERIRELSEMYQIKIQVHNIKTKAKFKKSLLKKEILSSQIVKKHILINNYDFFINAFIEEFYQWKLL